MLVNVLDQAGALPTRNHRESRFEGAAAISGEALKREHVQRRSACRGCIIGCARRTSAGGESGEGPEYESHLGVRRRVRRERPHGDRARQLRLQPRRHGHHHHGRDHRLRHGAHGARPAAGRPALRRRAGHHRPGRGHGRRRGPGRRARAGLGALRRAARPSRALDERQAARDAGLRPARHEGPGPGLRHQQPRRLSPARQHARPGDPRRPQDGRPLRDARQGRPADQPAEPERGAGFPQRVQVHRLRHEGGLLRPPAERRVGRDGGAAGAAAARRAHLERRAAVQPRRGLHARRRHSAAPAAVRARAGRAVRRAGSRLAADARRVLHLARLGRWRRAHGGQARAPRAHRDRCGGGRHPWVSESRAGRASGSSSAGTAAS